LLVRATPQDLDTVERVLEVVNEVPPQVQIDIKFVTMRQNDPKGLGFQWYSGTNLVMSNGFLIRNGVPVAPAGVDPDFPWGGTHILTDAQFRVAFKAIEQREGTDILAAPGITTLSGRQAHVSISETTDGIIKADPGTNAAATSLTNAMIETGPEMDVIPTVTADGFTIHLILNASWREFLGYDKSAQDLSQSNGVSGLQGGAVTHPAVPLAHFRTFSATTAVNVWDGQTVVLGGTIQDSAASQNQSTNSQGKNMLVFVTATIIDPAGNRVHREEEMPFAKGSVPNQAWPQAQPNPYATNSSK
jgi:general secretion pathway protein D